MLTVRGSNAKEMNRREGLRELMQPPTVFITWTINSSYQYSIIKHKNQKQYLPNLLIPENHRHLSL